MPPVLSWSAQTSTCAVLNLTMLGQRKPLGFGPTMRTRTSVRPGIEELTQRVSAMQSDSWTPVMGTAAVTRTLNWKPGIWLVVSHEPAGGAGAAKAGLPWTLPL